MPMDVRKKDITTCEIVDHSAVCAMLCVVQVQAQYIPLYATYTVHLSMPCTILCIQIELKIWNGVWGGRSISV